MPNTSSYFSKSIWPEKRAKSGLYQFQYCMLYFKKVLSN